MNEATHIPSPGPQKKILMILGAAVGLVVVLALADRWSARAPAAGSGMESRSVVPEVTLKDLQGNDVAFAQFRGKVVLVNFWATWCSPCRIEMPWFVDFQEKYGARGFTVVGVAMDEEGASVVEPFVRNEEFELDGRKVKVTYPILLGNDKIAEQFGGLIGLPTTLLISRDGRIASRFVGLVSHDRIAKEIEGLL